NATFAWTFGDPNASPVNPNTSAVSDPTHRYTKYGTYQVSLTASTSSTCTSTTTKPYTVQGFSPSINFEVLNENSLCSRWQVSLRNLTNTQPDSIYRIDIYWDNTNQPASFEADNTPG